MNIICHTALLTAAFITSCSAHAHGPKGAASHSFVENLGQWPGPFLYRADLNGATLFVERDGWTWTKMEGRTSHAMHDMANVPKTEDPTQLAGHAWRMRFAGASTELHHRALDPAPYYRNYFLGNDRARWKGRVPVYGEVLQEAVWPGVDVELSSVDGNFKYDIHLNVGADLGQVALVYEGLDDLSIDRDGSLRMNTSVGGLVEMAPVAYYADGAQEQLPCKFLLEGTTLRFAFPEGYDGSRPVVIDPLLIAATYCGTTGASTYGHCAAHDNEGNIYTGARNFGPVYPATVGAFQTGFGGGTVDIVLSKFNPDGSQLMWASYLGGSENEYPHSLIANAASELIVLGSSNSADFPVTSDAYDAIVNDQDITVTRIAFDGTFLLGSTYLGGSGSDGTNQMFGNYGEAFRGEVYLDGTGNIFVASFSNSSDFPVSTGAFQSTLGGNQDGVLVKLDPTCSNLLASTYLGGQDYDNAMGIRIATNGDLLVVGSTENAGFTMPPGGYMPVYQGGDTDGFVLRMSNDLTTLIAGTYFGTAEFDRNYFVDVDSQDNVWIYGQTGGVIPVFPDGTYGATGGEPFIAKLSSDLSSAPITTMLPGNLAPVAFVVDLCDRVYISGYQVTTNLPLTADALYQNGGFYLAVFEVDLTDLLFGSYYGGSHVDGGTSRFDKNGVIYQGVCSGGQTMPTTPWAYAPVNQAAWDVGVFKIDMEQCDITTSLVGRRATETSTMALRMENDRINIELPNSMANAWIYITDATGRLVEEHKAQRTQLVVDISHLKPGTYQAVALNGAEVLRGRFVPVR